jgi:rRNA maturation endonuclease Nob1
MSVEEIREELKKYDRWMWLSERQIKRIGELVKELERKPE